MGRERERQRDILWWVKNSFGWERERERQRERERERQKDREIEAETHLLVDNKFLRAGERERDRKIEKERQRDIFCMGNNSLGERQTEKER